jgi:hypothetical protein
LRRRHPVTATPVAPGVRQSCPVAAAPYAGGPSAHAAWPCICLPARDVMDHLGTRKTGLAPRHPQLAQGRRRGRRLHRSGGGDERRKQDERAQSPLALGRPAARRHTGKSTHGTSSLALPRPRCTKPRQDPTDMREACSAAGRPLPSPTSETKVSPQCKSEI